MAKIQPSAAKWNILGTNDASFNDGTGFPDGVAVQLGYAVSSAVATGTTTIPSDDTIPQNTEGTEFMTASITPKSATNILVIEVQALLASNTASRDINGAIFQDSIADALTADSVRSSSDDADRSKQLVVRHIMVAGTTSATTFKFRAGPSAAATVTFNGTAATRRFGAITKSSITITEYKAS